MKHNAEKAIPYVEKALALMGGDFALSKARSYLSAALNEIAHVDKKRKKRDYNLKQEEIYEKEKKLSAEEARKRIYLLDQMLKEEEAKLQNELK